jgi:hypothetical protein
MIDHLPEDLARAMAKADKARQRRASRLMVQIGDRSYRILRHWQGGFAIDATDLGPLRGRAEMTDGARASWTCLIVASRIEGDELICTFKQMTAARHLPPPDYARPEAAIAGYLPRA